MTVIKTLAVFCGASNGASIAYAEDAKKLVALMAEKNITLVYGGSSVGIMGVLAEAAIACNGKVIGVVPESLTAKEFVHTGLTELHVVKNLHERKSLMAGLADGFVLLPGGIGSLEEFFEVWTWSQLGLHNKPCGILNTNGYFDYLLSFLQHATTEEFLDSRHQQMIMIKDNPAALIQVFEQYQAPLPRWVELQK